jgi:hypothetical protein
VHSSLEVLEPRIAPALIISMPDGGGGNTVSNVPLNQIGGSNGNAIHWPSSTFVLEIIALGEPLASLIPTPGLGFDLIPHAFSATGIQSLGSLSKPMADGPLKAANLSFLLDSVARTTALGPSALRSTFSASASTLFSGVFESLLTGSALDAGIWD